MRGIRMMASVAAALALLSAPLAGQGGPPRQGPTMGRGLLEGGPAAMARNPVTVVLDHREELELSDDQVETLRGLEARVDDENGPRWERLEEAFGDAAPMEMTVEERRALRDRMQELRPVREEIRTTNRAVMSDVHELLTDDQEAALRSVMRRGPEGRPGRGMRRRGGDAMIGAAWRAGYRAGMARGCGAGAPGGPAGG